MITGLERNDWGVVPWVDQGEVVGAHLVDTLGVLINERGVNDRVGTGLVIDNTKQCVGLGDTVGGSERQVLIGGVVGPFGWDGHVAASPEQGLDRVREANVDRARGVGVEVLDWGSLNLLDENVAWCAGHLLALVVGDDGVVGPDIDIRHDLVGVRVEQVAWDDWSRGPDALNVLVNGEQIAEVAESKVDAHFVVWQSSGWQSDTRVTRVEEWQWQVKSGRWQDLLTSSVYVNLASIFTSELGWRWEGNSAWVGKRIDVTNHVVVTVALAGWDGEGRPEVEVVVIEASGNEIVEGDSAFRDQVVHQVSGPAKDSVTIGGSNGSVGSGSSNSVHGQTQPGVQQVITGTRDRNRPLLTKSGLTRATAQADWDLSKPSRLANFANEIGNSIWTAVQVLLLFIISGKINKS